MNGTWRTIELAGKPVDVFEPMRKPVAFGLLYLHPSGLEMPHSRPAMARLIDELGMACLCPHGQRSWWTDRIWQEFDARTTPEAHLMRNVLPHFAERWNLQPPAIGLVGISMGGQGALKLAFKHPLVFPAVAAISSALEYELLHGHDPAITAMYDSKEQCRQDTAILHVHPSHFPPHVFFCIDPDDSLWYRGNDRLHEKLSALGVEHQHDLTTQAGGHTWQYFDWGFEKALKFLHGSLITQSRRIL